MAEDMFALEGKVAVVTGGNGGLGLGMALGLAQAGATIAIAARDEGKAADAIRTIEETGGSCAFFPVDIASRDSCFAMAHAVVEHFGSCDILVNNAGTTIRRRPEELTEADWQYVIGINLTGSLYCAQAVYEPMKAAGGGKILNIGSLFSIFGAPLVAAYAASKGGIIQLTQSLAAAWAPDNIQVNAILPGYIETEMTARIRTQNPSLDETVMQRTPAARWGNPHDLAGPAAFFCSSASDFVTGTALPVDGGYSSRG